MRDLGLKLWGGFSRCVRCNEPLRPVDKQQVAERVPPYVFEHHCRFMECPRCHRLYWRGAHWSDMVSELERVYQEVH